MSGRYLLFPGREQLALLRAQGHGVRDIARRLKRAHWRRDVTLREDRSPIRSNASPRAMAALRNTLLNVVRDAAEPPRA